MTRNIARCGLDALFLFACCLLWGGAAWGVEPSVAVTVAQVGEAFVVDVLAEVPMPPSVAWDVLTDFDHMALFIGNIKLSSVTRRQANTLWVKQEGVAEYGPFSLPFKSEREIRLEPKLRIVSKSLSGSMKRMDSEAQIRPSADGVQIIYHAEAVPDSALARMFGATVVRHEIGEQFRELTGEMMRRHPPGE